MKSCFIKLLSSLLVLAIISCGNKSTEPNENRAPAVPSNPSPAQGATNQNPNLVLSWQAIDPDGDSLTYDIFLGTQSSPPLVKSNHNQASFTPDTLQINATYYWRVVARDYHGKETPGPLWNFMVMSFPHGFYVLSAYSGLQAYGGVVVSGQYAYLGSEGYATLKILNISNPYSPLLVGSDSSNYLGVVPGTIEAISGNLAFLRCPPEDYYDIEMRIIDVSIPTAPNPIAMYHGSYQYCNIGHITVYGNYAFVGLEATVLEIVDISDPSNPQFTSNIYLPRASAGAIIVSGDYTYVAGSSESEIGNRKATLWVVDTRDVYQPIIVSYNDNLSPGYSGAVDMVIRDNYAYIAIEGGSNEGVVVANLSVPNNPNAVGYYHGRSGRLFISGSYGYLTGDYGLDLIDISSPTNPVFVDQWQYGDYPAIYGRCYFSNDYLYVASAGRLIILRYTP